jgi:protein TonB
MLPDGGENGDSMWRLGLVATMLACTLPAAANAQTQAAQAADQPILTATDVRWIPSKKSPPRRYYPERAQRKGIEGKATVICKVADNGDLTCTSEAESPEGYGFGEAAAVLVSTMRIGTLTKSGQPTSGRLVRVPFTFKLR